MNKSFNLKINVINGELKEFPETMLFRCDDVQPLGMTTIRYFDDEDCSVVHRTFYLKVGQNMFGTNQFRTMEDFYTYLNIVCVDYISTIDGCLILIDGQKVNFL